MPRNRMEIVQRFYPKVTRIVDASKSATFKVTAQDAKFSRRKSVDGCALAKACQREYDGAIISMSTAYLIKGQKAIRYEVPPSIARELVSFDRHHDFSPGTYKLNAPSPSFQLGADKRKRDFRNERKVRTFGKRKVSHYTTGVRTLKSLA